MFDKDVNFSLWCDFIERNFLNEEFEVLLDKKVVNGATSNPAIFKSSFLNSEAYKKDREALRGKHAKEVYENLAIKDISLAADKMKHLYDKSNNNGFISIEVDPFLCDDAKSTIEEGKRLFYAIGKKNVMIKIPATIAGYEAMEELMSCGININATLIFSPTQAKNTIEAFKRATQKLENNNITSKILPKGVISVFVSRFDSKLDVKLAKLNLEESKVGILNAMKIYDLIQSYNMPHIRTLFASTGVKRDNLQRDYYIRELLLKNSINTAPLIAIKAFVNQKDKEIIKSNKEYNTFFKVLEDNKIDMELVYEELMNEGLVSFKEAFNQILKEL